MTFVPPTSNESMVDQVIALLRHEKVEPRQLEALNNAVKFAQGKQLGESIMRHVGEIFRMPIYPHPAQHRDDGSGSEALPPVPFVDDAQHLIGYVDYPEMRRDGTEGSVTEGDNT